MERARAAAWLGIVAAVAVAALAAVPYLLANPSAVGVYYGAGPGGPPVVALFALLAGLFLLAGDRGRTDPALAAGGALALGLFAAGLSAWWAVSVDPQIAAGVSATDIFRRYHRWSIALGAVVLPVASGWYARAVL